MMSYASWGSESQLEIAILGGAIYLLLAARATPPKIYSVMPWRQLVVPSSTSLSPKVPANQGTKYFLDGSLPAPAPPLLAGTPAPAPPTPLRSIAPLNSVYPLLSGAENQPSARRPA